MKVINLDSLTSVPRNTKSDGNCPPKMQSSGLQVTRCSQLSQDTARGQSFCPALCPSCKEPSPRRAAPHSGESETVSMRTPGPCPQQVWILLEDTAHICVWKPLWNIYVAALCVLQTSTVHGVPRETFCLTVGRDPACYLSGVTEARLMGYI